MPDENIENDVRLTPGGDAIPGRDEPGSEHQLWLAMQAAHNQYRTASAALDALTALSPGGFPSSERSLQIEMVTAEQRTAFEDYIDTRLQLSELLVSRRILVPPPTTRATARGRETEEIRSRFSGAVILAILAAFLFPTAFAIGYLARERKQIHALEASREEAAAVLAQTRAEIKGLAQKIESFRTAQRAAARAAAARDLAMAKRARAVRPALRAPVSPVRAVARNHQEVVQLERRGERNYHEFTVNSRNQFERVGPVGLTVLRVDPRRQYFDVAIAVENEGTSRKRLNLYEPVWIDLKGRHKALELVVNRISEDEIHGYLSEPRFPRLSWRQVPQQEVATLSLP